MKSKKALLIAPLPPPVTGNSLAVKIFLDELNKSYQTEVVNLSKDNFKSGVASLNRIIEIVKVLKEVRKKKKGTSLVYFTISQSIAGNLKDILVYLISYRSLNKMVIHLHGGPGMRRIMANKKSLLYKLNKFFIKRLGGVIVLGQSHLDIYSGLLEDKKLHIVPNFAEDYLFLKEEEIAGKFKHTKPVKLLFLSNLIEGKGHIELLEAYLSMNEQLKEKVTIDFAGGFETDEKKQDFLQKISGVKGLTYHGIVSGNAKKEVFKNAHVFCLPTYYQYEGQPISILEAYASGCAVITTNHSGIRDVFADSVNGFEVEKRSAPSLKAALERIIAAPEALQPIALRNHQTALERYTTSNYNAALIRIMNIMEP